MRGMRVSAIVVLGALPALLAAADGFGIRVGPLGFGYHHRRHHHRPTFYFGYDPWFDRYNGYWSPWGYGYYPGWGYGWRSYRSARTKPAGAPKFHGNDVNFRRSPGKRIKKVSAETKRPTAARRAARENSALLAQLSGTISNVRRPLARPTAGASTEQGGQPGADVPPNEKPAEENADE